MLLLDTVRCVFNISNSFANRFFLLFSKLAFATISIVKKKKVAYPFKSKIIIGLITMNS